MFDILNQSLGNFSSRRARFTEKKSLRATLKAKHFLAGHSVFEKCCFKQKRHILEQKCDEINIT